MNFKRIDAEQARVLLATSAGKSTQVVDIRDDQSFARGHIDSATHLHNSNLQEFLDAADLEAPLLVYCYHGNMSLSAAAYFAEQGFVDAYSLDGGYDAWSAANTSK